MPDVSTLSAAELEEMLAAKKHDEHMARLERRVENCVDKIEAAKRNHANAVEALAAARSEGLQTPREPKPGDVSLEVPAGQLSADPS